MRIPVTPVSSLIIGVLFLVAGIATVVADGGSFRGVVFCVIGVIGLIGALVQASGGTGDVASAKLQRRRRERFRRR